MSHLSLLPSSAYVIPERRGRQDNNVNGTSSSRDRLRPSLRATPPPQSTVAITLSAACSQQTAAGLRHSSDCDRRLSRPKECAIKDTGTLHHLKPARENETSENRRRREGTSGKCHGGHALGSRVPQARLGSSGHVLSESSQPAMEARPPSKRGGGGGGGGGYWVSASSLQRL